MAIPSVNYFDERWRYRLRRRIGAAEADFRMMTGKSEMAFLREPPQGWWCLPNALEGRGGRRRVQQPTQPSFGAARAGPMSHGETEILNALAEPLGPWVLAGNLLGDSIDRARQPGSVW